MKNRICSVIATLIIAAVPFYADEKPKPKPEKKAATLTEEEKEIIKDREILENLDLLQNFDKVRHLELLVDDDASDEENPKSADTKKEEKK
jgi:hypothetical protein